MMVGTEILYAVYVWTVFFLLAPITWLLTAATPRPAWANSSFHARTCSAWGRNSWGALPRSRVPKTRIAWLTW